LLNRRECHGSQLAPEQSHPGGPEFESP
jgi:hypothetical protein